MNDELYKYLEKEWRYNNHKKYQKYFKEFVDNLTPKQILYFTAHMNGKMSIY
jgi:hypothetical protein